MSKKVAGILLLGVCALGLSAASMTLDEALALFQNDQIMVEYSDAGKAQLEEIITAFKSALGVPAGLDEKSEDRVGELSIPMELKDVVNKLSQAYYTLANVFMPEKQRATWDTYTYGKNWGFKSLRMNPEFNDLTGGRLDDSVSRETDVAALYWTNANWLRSSEENIIGAVAAGVDRKTKMMTERILELDPNYVAGGGYRSFGGFYSELPLLLKDLGKALQNLCHVVDEPALCSDCGVTMSVSNASAYFENRTFFVKYYLIKKDKWADAARVLQSVLDEPIGEIYPLMNAYSQQQAQTMLVEVQKHL